MASTAERNERRPSKAGPSRPERERALDPGIQKGQPLLTLQTDGRSASGPPMKKTRSGSDETFLFVRRYVGAFRKSTRAK